MSFTVKHNKKTNCKTFTYRGDLVETIKKAKKELEEKTNSEKRTFLLWQYNKAKKEFDTYELRIEDLKAFISAAEAHLRKKTKNETN